LLSRPRAVACSTGSQQPLVRDRTTKSFFNHGTNVLAALTSAFERQWQWQSLGSPCLGCVKSGSGSEPRMIDDEPRRNVHGNTLGEENATAPVRECISIPSCVRRNQRTRGRNRFLRMAINQALAASPPPHAIEVR
jgi:hypothetical protein